MEQEYDLYNPDEEFIVSGREMNLILTEERTNAYLEGLRASNNKVSTKPKEVLDHIKKEDTFKQAIDEYCGNFYFSFYKRLIDEIESQYLFRFLYLCSFVSYSNNNDSDGKLVIKINNKSRYILSKDLRYILKLSEREYKYTRQALLETKLISINEENEVCINKKYCIRGYSKMRKGVAIVRMFDESIKYLYENSQAKDHKKIAKLIEMLPMVNLKWNIVCEDSKVEVMKDIKPISVTELAKKLGYSKAQTMKNGLFNLTLANGEKVIMSVKIDDLNMIIVNPRVYYKGTNLEDLDYCIGLFDIARGTVLLNNNKDLTFVE